ncbi:hypothetical protein ABT185_10665 [Streptomyces clavifer]|uniref:hypothetical protein n=1 Tax=Streptomyces clavifer TaxID=68188 RepID=UPI0033304977
MERHPTNELILTESRTMRQETIGKTEVLERVKTLTLLPDNLHVTTEMAAAYYEVSLDTLKSLILRNREELDSNGMQVLRGAELRAYKAETAVHREPLFLGVNSLRLFSRKALLNVGQLLTESQVATAVRRYLLDTEQAARPQPEPVEITGLKGIPTVDFHLTYFGDMRPKAFQDHLYRFGYLRNQLNARADKQGNLTKPGHQHRYPTAMGSRYFQLPAGRYVANGRERGGAVVRPDRVQELVQRLIREGLTANPMVASVPSRLALTRSETVDGNQVEFRRGA